jgi:hypothetical protein
VSVKRLPVVSVSQENVSQFSLYMEGYLTALKPHLLTLTEMFDSPWHL